MNCENSKTSDPYVLTLKLTDKLDLRRGETSTALSNLSIYYTWKNIESSYSNNKFKISASTWSDKFELPDGSYFSFIFQDHILDLFQIFRIVLGIYNFEYICKNDKNVPHLEITEVALVHYNIVNNNFQQDSRVLYTFVRNELFGILLKISPKK